MPDREKRYGDPFNGLDEEDGVSRADVAKATGKDSIEAGQYLRYTFTWTEKQLELVESVARKYRLSKNAAARWLLDRGLVACLVNGEDPVLEDEDSFRPQPRLEEW